MAGDLGWKSVELQIEAIIPGLLILGEAYAVTVPSFTDRAKLLLLVPRSDFVQASLFVAAAYAAGVVASYVSRILLDGISERGPRMLVFGAIAHERRKAAIRECRKNDKRFRSDYRCEKRKRKWRRVAAWNAIYRSALRRTTRGNEVDRRRSQGRFLRNLLIPVAGAPFVVASPLSVLLSIAGVLTLVFLYAYAEYVNFAEAYDISEATSK